MFLNHDTSILTQNIVKFNLFELKLQERGKIQEIINHSSLLQPSWVAGPLPFIGNY